MNKRRIFILVLLVGLVCYVSLVIERYNYRKSWEAKTSPLPQETISALCSNLSLDSNHRLCNGSKNVYAPDFTDVLRDYFPLENSMETPKNKTTITYQEVEKVIGNYKTECQEVVHQRDFSYFRCFYDFRGDDYWRDVFYFYYPEETLFSIRSGSSDDS